MYFIKNKVVIGDFFIFFLRRHQDENQMQRKGTLDRGTEKNLTSSRTLEIETTSKNIFHLPTDKRKI